MRQGCQVRLVFYSPYVILSPTGFAMDPPDTADPTFQNRMGQEIPLTNSRVQVPDTVGTLGFAVNKQATHIAMKIQMENAQGRHILGPPQMENSVMLFSYVDYTHDTPFDKSGIPPG